MNILNALFLLPIIFLIFGETSAQEFTQSDFGPRISPNGKHIVFYSYRNDSLPDIYMIDIEKGKEIQLTTSYQSWDLNSKWSKDGITSIFLQIVRVICPSFV